MIRYLLLILSILLCNLSAANPTSDLQMIGKGKMEWLFFDLYEIKLFSHNGLYQHQQYPQALSIHYLRDIEKNDLLTATKEQWQHLNIPWQTQWLDELDQLWPSVKKNDEITLVVSVSGISHFYYNQKILGQINSKAFSDAFMAIWLATNTSEPKLRQQLINSLP